MGGEGVWKRYTPRTWVPRSCTWWFLGPEKLWPQDPTLPEACWAAECCGPLKAGYQDLALHPPLCPRAWGPGGSACCYLKSWDTGSFLCIPVRQS